MFMLLGLMSLKASLQNLGNGPEKVLGAGQEST